MNEIIKRTVFEVDGVQFDTCAEAMDRVEGIKRQMALQELIYDTSELNTADSEEAAKAIMQNFARVRTIMEGAQ